MCLCALALIASIMLCVIRLFPSQRLSPHPSLSRDLAALSRDLAASCHPGGAAPPARRLGSESRACVAPHFPLLDLKAPP